MTVDGDSILHSLAPSDGITKLNRRAEPSEYSRIELEIVLDALANHYEDLDEIWRHYYEKLLAYTPDRTKA